MTAAEKIGPSTAEPMASAASTIEPTLSRARERRPRRTVPSSEVICSSSRSVEGRVAPGRTARARPPTRSIAAAARTAGTVSVSQLGAVSSGSGGGRHGDERQPVEEQLHGEIAAGGHGQHHDPGQAGELDPAGATGGAQPDPEDAQGCDVAAIVAQVARHSRDQGEQRDQPAEDRHQLVGPGLVRSRRGAERAAYVIERLRLGAGRVGQRGQHLGRGVGGDHDRGLRDRHGRPGADHARGQVGELTDRVEQRQRVEAGRPRRAPGRCRRRRAGGRARRRPRARGRDAENACDGEMLELALGARPDLERRRAR